MKKLPIKRILVLTIFISVIVGMIYWQYVKKNKENNFQENSPREILKVKRIKIHLVSLDYAHS